MPTGTKLTLVPRYRQGSYKAPIGFDFECCLNEKASMRVNSEVPLLADPPDVGLHAELRLLLDAYPRMQVRVAVLALDTYPRMQVRSWAGRLVAVAMQRKAETATPLAVEPLAVEPLAEPRFRLSPEQTQVLRASA